jgi:hypothetical protein
VDTALGLGDSNSNITHSLPGARLYVIAYDPGKLHWVDTPFGEGDITEPPYSFLQLSSAGGLPLPKRLICELLSLADQFGDPDPRRTAIGIPITHADLADCVGASRQRVPQYLRLLERKRALSKSGRTIIVTSRSCGGCSKGAFKSVWFRDPPFSLRRHL